MHCPVLRVDKVIAMKTVCSFLAHAVVLGCTCKQNRPCTLTDDRLFTENVQYILTAYTVNNS